MCCILFSTLLSFSCSQTHDTVRFASCFNWLCLQRTHLQEWDIQGSLGSVQLSFSVLLNFEWIIFRVFVFGSKVLSENALWFSRTTSFIRNELLLFKWNVNKLAISRESHTLAEGHSIKGTFCQQQLLWFQSTTLNYKHFINKVTNICIMWNIITIILLIPTTVMMITIIIIKIPKILIWGLMGSLSAQPSTKTVACSELWPPHVTYAAQRGHLC